VNQTTVKPKAKPERKKRPISLYLLVIFLIGLVAWMMPVPKLRAESTYIYKSPVSPVDLAWPDYGQSSVGAVGYGVLDSQGGQVPAPMASLTKVVTAMAVLNKKPLGNGSQGGNIKITATDVDNYNGYVGKGGSVVPVSAGEELSEYQALQAMLLPSANNMADTLARWAFGSMNNYTAFANSYVKTLGLKQTNVADASGFDPSSVSSAQDLTILGLAAYNNPVLRNIFGQKSAEIPVAGTIHSTNWLLGQGGNVGIKTGNTQQAGGCYLFADQRNIKGQTVTVIGAIMGAPDLSTAISDSRPLSQSVDNGFAKVTVANKGQVVGIMVPDWGDKTNIYAEHDLSMLTWKTRQVVSSMKIDLSGRSLKQGQTVGQLVATVWDKTSGVDIAVADKVSGPSLGWRVYGRYFGG
jgi:D-alanyl-D-alanine carboxypeptidase (penicillin-binding protein 5/6)